MNAKELSDLIDPFIIIIIFYIIGIIDIYNFILWCSSFKHHPISEWGIAIHGLMFIEIFSILMLVIYFRKPRYNLWILGALSSFLAKSWTSMCANRSQPLLAVLGVLLIAAIATGLLYRINKVGVRSPPGQQ